MTKPWKDKEKLRKAYHNSETQAEVGEKFGCSGATISRWLNKFNINTEHPDKGNGYTNKKNLKEKYEELGTVRKVSEHFDSNVSTIHKWMNRFGIEANEPTKEDRHNWVNRISKPCEYCSSKIEVPETQKNTVRFCSRECKGNWMSENLKGENHPMWKGGYLIDYGDSWPQQRRKVRERDENICQKCGSDNGDSKPDVHHIKPIRKFDNPNVGNTLDNLIQLCSKCHREMESYSPEKQREILNLN